MFAKEIIGKVITSGAVFCLSALCFGQQVSVAPKDGPPTTTVGVSGSGFAPHAQINIYFDRNDEALVVADGSGSFSKVSIEAPAGAVAGKHWVSAVQKSGFTGAQSPFWVHTDWSQLGFEPGHSWRNPYENTLNIQTVHGLNLEWSSALAPSETVAVVKDAIYLGSGDSVYSLDGFTGDVRWQYATSAPVQGTPAVDGTSVFFGSNDFNVYALAANTGALLWKFATGSFVVSSVTAANGAVYAGSDDNSVYALSESSGTLLWKFATQGPIQFAPSVFNGTVYVASADGNIYALNASSGALVWQFTTTPQNNSTTPSVVNGVLYVASADQNLYALNASNGNLLWKTNLGAPSDGCYAAVANGMIYVGSGDGGIFYGLDANTGAIRWTFTTRVPVYAASAVADGVVYFGDGNGNFYALEAASGKQLWKYTTGRFFPSATVTDGRVFLSADALDVFDVPQDSDAASERPDLPSLGR